MAFESILFPPQHAKPSGTAATAPSHFVDLHLDQVMRAVTAGYEDYDLLPIYQAPLRDPDTVRYRQDVMTDCAAEAMLHLIEAFAAEMRKVRQLLSQAEKLHYPKEKQAWHLQAADCYGSAVQTVLGSLRGMRPASEGLMAFREYLADLVEASPFLELRRETSELAAALADIQFSLLLGEGSTVTVQAYAGEQDYTAAVQQTFEKFRREGAKDYRSRFADDKGLNHIEAQVLDRVALLYPDLFARLERFCDRHGDFQDVVITRFDREVHFYLAYIRYTARFSAQGLPFCRPAISGRSKEVRCRSGFDLSLAAVLQQDKGPIVCNDFELRDPERILVVSGANQGGKTTFARMFGQLHYLAALGCNVPAKEATLFLGDGIYTHFEREETVATLRGKLYDDVVRMHDILERATSDSIIVMNEIFSSTALKDASVLARDVIYRISEVDALAVCVTFMAELATLDEKTTSYVSLVDPADPAIRSFRVERRPADGQAHAMALARKHGLSYEQLHRQVLP